jgi:DNA adenine methylase
MRSPIKWYGGKGQIAAKIIGYLPPHVTYVEPFGGAASVLFAKEPSAVEVYNDVHSGVVNLWRVLRDTDRFEDFRRLCALTPYSREEYDTCCATWETEADPTVKAWKFFVGCRMAFSGYLGHGWAVSKDTPRRGMSMVVSAYLSAVDGLEDVCRRLSTVQIEHGPYTRVLSQYDTPDTLFYCDPPYVSDTRVSPNVYTHEFTEKDQLDLVSALSRVQGRVVLSGYANLLYDAALEPLGWARYDFTTQLRSARATEGKKRVESVWLNPAAIEARKAA